MSGKPPLKDGRVFCHKEFEYQRNRAIPPQPRLPAMGNQNGSIRIVLSLRHSAVLHSNSCYLKPIWGVSARQVVVVWGEDPAASATCLSSLAHGGLVGTCVEPERGEASRYEKPEPEPHGEVSREGD